MRYVYLWLMIWAQPLYAFSWQDLWMTDDQQAQQFMQQGKFSEALKQFHQPDWQAVAAYRAGQYEKAEQLFSSFNTEQGYYNQGNALAHLGHYREAIKAYDKALRVNPTNKDAQYNRKLVADLLKKEQNKQQQQQNNEQNQPNQPDQQPDKKQNEQNKAKAPNNENKLNKTNDQDKQKKQEKEKEKEKDQQKNQQRDANNKSTAQTQSTADREQQQARDQWLRLVPDEPGGLLKEKFLRDHLRRQQELQP